MGKQLSRGGKRKIAGAAALAVCLALLVLLIGAAIGRYQRQLRAEGSARAPEFYFTSDLLDGGTHTLAPGSTQVSFILSNHADDLRFSQVDIAYTVTVEGGASVAVNPAAGTLEKDRKADGKITVSNLTPGTYTVKAVGKGGYSKTLEAVIVVLPEEARLYWHRENVPGEYTLLTVWNEGDTAGTVTVQYTGIPDNTNPNMGNWLTGTDTKRSQTVTVPPHASKVFRFFGESVTISVTDAESNPVETKIPG